MRKRTHLRLQGQRGQALIESLLMLVVIITVVLWVFELGWLMYTYSVLADAANEGVRYAIVHSGADPSGTTSRVVAFAGTSLHNVSGISVAVSHPDNDYVPPHRVSVSVTYTYVPWLQGFINTPTMKTYAEGRMIVP